MNEEVNISLEEYFIIIRQRIWLIILITLSTVAIAGIISFFVIKPTYQASTSIIVGKPQSTTGKETSQYSDVMMYQNLIKTYSEIAKSKLVEQAAGDILKDKGNNLLTKTSITVTPQTGTQILIISAKSKSAKEAYEVTNATSQAFVESAKKVFPTGGDIQVMDNAVLPQNPISPNKKLNIAIAFFLGLMVSVGVVLLLEYLDNTMKTEGDVDRYLQLPVLGVIPKMTQ